MDLQSEIARLIKGDVLNDPATRKFYSRDTSIFERTPTAVVFPKNADDVSAVVRFAHAAKLKGEEVSVTARSAGTDMTGGPLTNSIALVFTKYMNRILGVERDSARAEPGVFYRDFEKSTLAKSGHLLPSFPASREICALGGMIGNNAGGEMTLQYGKTNCYVQELDVVFSDGSRAILEPLSADTLAQKKSLQTFEGDIYRKTHALLEQNRSMIEAARPRVSKNSAGYALWDIERNGIFDLTQLIVGSQGTLALVTEASLRLIKPKEHRAMLVIFLSDIKTLPDIVHRVLKFEPESFESYDNHTFRLAVRFFPQIVRHAGAAKVLSLALSFTSEVWMILTGGVPKLVLLAEFAEHTLQEAQAKAHAALGALHNLPVRTKIAGSETASEKYWAIRRESFSLLRQNLHGLYAAPFIDDIVVPPDVYPQFLPELTAILEEHKLLYTIAGHVGEGNFHIIPLMDLGSPEARREILELTPKVYKLVAKYKGSITGEHNDGIIRTPYLPLMFEPQMIELFAEVKKIFDPLNILNPGKKVGGTLADLKDSMIRSS